MVRKEKHWTKLTKCRRCEATRYKEAEGNVFMEYAEGSDEIVDEYWLCEKESIEKEMYG